jgi:glycosyltransferase involved in cell wall biosynthesis
VTAPRFSVVVPAYNAPRTVGPAIESILAQTARDLELVVVDDGSTDETPEVVRSYERQDHRVRLVTQANQGVAGARNTGIRLARGRFVSFLDNDDLWLPTYLEEMERALEADPQAGFAYTDGWTLEDSTKRIRVASAMSGSDPPEQPPRDVGQLMTSLVRINFVLSSATVRRDVLEEVGAFDPAANAVDDYDLWLRIVAAGYRAARPPGRLVIQRERAGSQSKDQLLMARGIRQALVPVVETYDAPPEAKALARRRIRQLDRQIAGLSGASRSAALLWRGRSAIAGLRRRLRPAPACFDQPPREVAEAFPDLSAV